MTHPDRSWRASLEARIANRASELQVAPERIRRQVAFQRVLARLSGQPGWVLKGGFCLETRLDVARATVDLDMATSVRPADAGVLQDLLDDTLDRDVDGDGFSFRVGIPRPMSVEDTGNEGWRVGVTAMLAGRAFQSLRLDVVPRPAEIAGGVEKLVVPPALAGTRMTAVAISAVDVAQHAAEKAHAYARVYAYERSSTRVKDLVDLVLMVEAGLLDAAAWGRRLGHVYRVRDAAVPPKALVEPPPSWGAPYAALAAELRLGARDLAAAYELVCPIYQDAAQVAASTQERNP